MKLVIFAHTPPPHHGQSYMVQLMLEGFGGDRRKSNDPPESVAKYGIECYHVNARVSRNLETIGTFRLEKTFLLLGYCLSAIWCRFRYGAETLFYIPAPGKRSALLRDWMVMLVCRPFFKKIIFQWQAAGLGTWLETSVKKPTRFLTCKLMKHADLSVVLSDYNRSDADKLLARKTVVVPNAIPDPCPDFDKCLLPRRLTRSAARRRISSWEKLSVAECEKAGGDPQIFKVLFLAHCTREKGLFDTIDGVALANRQLEKSGSPIRIHLNVAGTFIQPLEQAEFEKRMSQSDLIVKIGDAPQLCVRYHGFASGAEKFRIFAENDCFCFPTYYYAESFGIVLIEAMAFNLQIITSRWRAVPEVMPKDFAGFVEPQQPREIATALLAAVASDFQPHLREHFLKHFTIDKHLDKLAAAFHSIE